MLLNTLAEEGALDCAGGLRRVQLGELGVATGLQLARERRKVGDQIVDERVLTRLGSLGGARP